ncbi:MAG: glycoside hydrolase family 127 protein [Clostridia bacterium]|nr:glycoside hydrolase family 127 protein [Clostridia bacterium]
MYNFFNPTEIKPHGWIRRQLELQLNGLGGNLDKMWPDVRDSAWVGGDREGWERVPYWLDGFIPLAYLLDDKDAIARAAYYINAIVDRQQKDGWICPCTKEEREKYDTWSFMLIGKVLAQYCEFTGDERVYNALYRAMKCFYNQLKNKKIKLFNWGAFRYYECMIPLQYIYDRNPEKWVLSFARLLCKQGEDYSKYKETWKRPLFKWTLYTHIVNLNMTFKEEAVIATLLGKKIKNKAEKFWNILDKYNGTAVATFTGDECLAGKYNNQGFELCSVVELMYSCEILYALTGDPIWAERLEKMAFNALPATISDDMWTHQYVQLVNQISCQRFPGRPHFTSNNHEAHMFGLEPHFGCCTANHVQGWPKLVTSMFIRTDDGIRVTSMLPTELSTNINGAAVNLKIDTEYPFRHSGKFTVTTDKKVEFALHIRVPAWAKTCTVNGKAFDGKEIVISKAWNGTETVEVAFTDVPHTVERPYGLKVVEYGPLVFSLPIETEYKMYEYERKGVERKAPYCDYELIPKSEWRYGFANEEFSVCDLEGGDIPFGQKMPRVGIKANLARVNWDYKQGFNIVANVTPLSRNAMGDAEEIMLIPYGCAKLRMTEMPILKMKK